MSTEFICLYGIILIVLTALGTKLGKKAQEITHFAYPWDPITVAVLAGASAVIIYDLTIQIYIVSVSIVAIIVGYLLGYFINGRQDYTYVVTLVKGERLLIDEKPWVLFENDDGDLCKQDQSWKALWNQWRWGNYHIINCPRGMEQNIEHNIEPYLYPQIKCKVILVERIIPYSESREVYRSPKMVEKDGKYIPKKVVVKQHKVTTIYTAHIHSTSIWNFLMNLDILAKANARIEELEKDLYFMKARLGPASIEAIGSFLAEQAMREPGAMTMAARGYFKDASRVAKPEEGAE